MKILSILSFLLFIANSALGCGATISPNQTLCFDPANSYTVTFTGNGGTAPYTFTYHIGSGSNQTITSDASGVATLTVPMTAQGYYNYIVTNVTDNGGCSQNLNVSSYVFLQGNMNAFISGTTTVYQNSTPAPVVTFNCSGGVPPIIFSYTINNGPVQTITSNNQGMAFLSAPTDQVGTFVYELVGYQSSMNCPGSGISNISTNTVTITVNPAPPAPSGTVSISGVCDHYTLNFQGSGGLTPNYSYTYTLNGVTYTQNGGSNFSINGPSVFSPTSYTLSGVSVTNNGSTGTLSGSSTKTIYPNSTNSLACNTNSVCLNGTSPVLTFTRYGGFGAYSFSYTVNSGPVQTLNPGVSTLNVPTNVAGSFTYVVLSSGQMCDNTPYMPVTITVKPLPTATISGTTSVCNGATSPVITFTGTSGTGPYTFTYKINGGANQTISTSGSSNTVTLPVSTSTSGVFVYSLVSVSSVAGCSQSQSGTATVNVNSKPTAAIAGGTSVCQNSNNSPITFTGAGGTQPYTFVYSLNGGTNQSVSSGGTSTATVNQSNSSPGSYTYQLLSVTGANGCSQTYSSNAVILVKETPQATISGSSVVCQNAGNQQVVFTSPGTDFPYTYSYKLNGGAVQTITSNSSSGVPLSVSSATAGTFTYDLLNVTGANGCSQTQSGSASIVVNSLPSASISGSTSVCQNDNQPVVTLGTSALNGPFDIVFNINGNANQTINSGANASVLLDVPTTTPGTLVYNLVSITDANGCSQAQNGSATVTINSMPAASISGGATICQNDSEPTVTLNGTAGNGSYNFVFNINGGANQTINSNGNSSVLIDVPTSASGSFVYNLVSVSDANGCSQTQSGSASIVVNSLPSASISGSTSVCQNDNQPVVTLGTSALNGPFDIVFNINGNANQTINSGANASVLLDVPTTTPGTLVYNLVSITDANGCSQAQNGSATVTINSMPSASISGGATICQNDLEPTVTLNGTAGNGSYNFVFNINGGANQTINSNGNSSVLIDVPTNASGSFVYNLVSVSDENGCSQTQSGSASIVVNSLPSASIVGNATVCQNDQNPAVLIEATGDNGPFNLVFNVNGGNNQTLSNNSSLLLVVPTDIPGDFVYNLVSVTDNNGCSQENLGAVTITVNPTPVTPTIQSSGANVICAGQAVTLTSSATTNLWSTGETSQSIVVNENGDYTVQEIQSGCSSDTSSVFTLEVIEVIDPQFEIAASYCQGTTIDNLPETSLNGVEGTWSPQISNTQTTTYTFTPSANSCATSVEQTITIHSLPDVGLSPIAMQCVYSSEFDLNQGTPIGGTYVVDGVTLSSFNPANYLAGSYPITYTFTDVNGCANQVSSTIVVDECLGLSNEGTSAIAVYPNPSNGVFNFTLQNNHVYVLEVFDQMGKKVLSSQLNTDNSRVDLTEFENGIYSIRLVSETQIWNTSVIKQ